MGFEVINGLAGRHLVLDAVMVFAAGPLIYLLFATGALAALLGLRNRDRSAQLWMVGQGAAALLLSFLISRVLRMIAIHERPFQTQEVTQLIDQDPGVSFPSNHATAALTVTLVIAIFVSGWWGAFLSVPAVLVAVSRVYVGVHWLSDIIGAVVVALSAVAIVWCIGWWWQKRFGPRPDPTGPGEQPTVVLARIDNHHQSQPTNSEQTVVLSRVPLGELPTPGQQSPGQPSPGQPSPGRHGRRRRAGPHRG